MMPRHFRGDRRLLLFGIIGIILSVVPDARAQDIRWLRVSDLQSFVTNIGMEYETQGTTGNLNYFSWPAQYSIDQNTVRSRLLWMGCKNFNDPVDGKLKSVKVVGSGPRDFDDRPNQIFEQEMRVIGRAAHPIVTVVTDVTQRASLLDQYDAVDDVDPSLPCDRMVVIRFNTSMGISVTKKVMVFANSLHGNYFLYDYVFKNTGIINRSGTVRSQTLQEVQFYFAYRYAFAGVSSNGWGSTWGAFASTWGNSTLHHAFGKDPNTSEFTYAGSPQRGFYSYYGPNSASNQAALTYAEDWGCPNVTEGDGMLGSAKYAGVIILHADRSASDNTDDPYQPKTSWFIGADIQEMQPGNQSQYDVTQMTQRYNIMTEGHPPLPHDQTVGEGVYPENYNDPRRSNAMQGQGFGPYSLAPGDSIHIVFAEGVAGISWEKGKEVGGNWIKWRNGRGQPPLTMPGGASTTDFNLYKRRWVETGKDSILKALGNAIDNYASGYTLPQPPPAPSEFTVESGGDRIRLTWASNAKSHPKFGGYVIYRSMGTVLDYRSTYEKIFECDASNAVHQFDDITANRGFDYFYYVQSKDDGTQIPGTTLYSSLFWTVTSVAARLQRPAVTSTLDSVRVVPNPYDIRGRFFQFGDRSQYDQIAVYGLPPVATLKIFTERGDLIWSKDHTSGTGDVIWTSQTMAGQMIASGVYILAVETPDNRSVIRKFIVIR